MIRGRDLAKSICGHAADRLVVHAVAGGHRAHCLRCGAIGPVRRDRAAARKAMPTGRGFWERPAGDAPATGGARR